MRLASRLIHRHIELTVVAILACCQAGRGEPTIPAGIESFSGELRRSGAYLLEPAELAVVDALNKDMREAKSQRRRNASQPQNEKAQARRAKAAQELLALLEKNAHVVRIEIRDGKFSPLHGGSITLPGDAGAILLRIDRGGPQISVSTAASDLSVNANADGVIGVEAPPESTTWALLALSNVPAKRTSLLLEVGKNDMKLRLPIDVQTPTFGRLRMKVLSADDGKPAPAMIRLHWKTLDMDRQPSGAIEFAPQFDNQGTPSGRRREQIPGIRGEYWCVPGPIDMEIPPGEWEVGVLRGAEHIPVTDAFTIEAGGLVEKSYTPRRWVNMTKLGWYSGDDHVHCRILSDDDANRLMSWVQAEDIHVANIVKMGDIDRTWFEQRGWGKAYRVITGDTILSPGQECPRTHQQLGHTISMNTKSMVRDTDRYYIYEEVADKVHAEGGLWGYAHVVSKMFHVDRDMSINIPKGKADFVELMQFGSLGTELYYDFLNTGFKVTASAGSDVPWGGSVGEARLYAYTGDQPFTADAWFEAVRKGRTFTTDGPMIDFRVDDAYPGDEIVVKENRKLHVKARAWGDAERTVPSKLTIVRHGEAIKTVESSDPNKNELSLDFEIDAGNGFWIAARVDGNNGTAAHTTPIYVVREGLRFWKFDDLDALLAKRLRSLDEVERIVAEATSQNEAKKLNANRALQQLAIQGPDLLKRVVAARQIYSDLKQTAEKERARRADTK